MSNALARILAGAAVAALGVAPHSAHACDFPAPSIATYARANPAYIVFVGTVVHTTRFWEKWLGAPDASTFTVSALYAGSLRQKSVTVVHIPAPDPKIFYCGPSRGFSAHEGEQLLIVGKQVGEFIAPESPLIARIGPKGLPGDFARELATFRRENPD